jgi:hypothetical protein
MKLIVVYKVSSYQEGRAEKVKGIAVYTASRNTKSDIIHYLRYI